jgi:hypothetical protein
VRAGVNSVVGWPVSKSKLPELTILPGRTTCTLSPLGTLLLVRLEQDDRIQEPEKSS